MNLKERLRYLRVSRGLSSRDVYEATGITQPSYYRYESGESEPTSQKLIALSDFYGVSIDYLVGRSDDPGHSDPGHSEEDVIQLNTPFARLREKLLVTDSRTAAEVENYLNYLISQKKAQKNSSQLKAADDK